MEKTINLEEMKRLQVEMLREFSKICDSNDLSYSLDFGTLLGAVRHKGFIPWDDDIDVMMPRDDYDKLIAIFNNCCEKEYMKIYSLSTKSNYAHSIAKVVDTRTRLIEKDICDKYNDLGVYIDIFPMERIPRDLNLRKKLAKRVFNCYFFSELARIRYRRGKNLITSILKWFMLVFCRIVKPFWFLRKIEKTIITCNKSDSNIYKNLVMPDVHTLADSNLGIVTSEDFKNKAKLEFELNDFSVISDYNRYLQEIYGDYMILPPEKDRVQSHNIEVYWK